MSISTQLRIVRVGTEPGIVLPTSVLKLLGLSPGDWVAVTADVEDIRLQRLERPAPAEFPYVSVKPDERYAIVDAGALRDAAATLDQTASTGTLSGTPGWGEPLC